MELPTRLGRDPACGGGIPEGLEVAFVLIGIGISELCKSPVEGRSVPEIAGDSDPVARSGVGSGQRLGADPDVLCEAARDRPFDLKTTFPVPELADIEVPGHAIWTFERLVPQEDVAGCLHQMLSGHNPRP